MSDNGTAKEKILVSIFLNEAGQLQWRWQNLSGENLEKVLLDVLRGQIAYNLQKQQQQKKIITPSLGQIVGINGDKNASKN